MYLPNTSPHGLCTLHGKLSLPRLRTNGSSMASKPHSADTRHTTSQVGLTDGQTTDEWTEEMLAARAAGIDGFALNIGPSDPWTAPQLRAAYAAAADLPGPGPAFVLFLSFDMAAGDWAVDQVADLIREFRDAAAQCTVVARAGAGGGVGGGGGAAQPLPLVSTFEGPAWAGNWEAVRRAVGGVFLVPDWSSLGPAGVGDRRDVVDGAFSWAAWPRAGEHRITAEEDVLYRRALRGKAYMMGVSPWFYTSESSSAFFYPFFSVSRLAKQIGRRACCSRILA